MSPDLPLRTPGTATVGRIRDVSSLVITIPGASKNRNKGDGLAEKTQALHRGAAGSDRTIFHGGAGYFLQGPIPKCPLSLPTYVVQSLKMRQIQESSLGDCATGSVGGLIDSEVCLKPSPGPPFSTVAMAVGL